MMIHEELPRRPGAPSLNVDANEQTLPYFPAFWIRLDPYHLVGSGSVSGNVDMDPGSAKY